MKHWLDEYLEALEQRVRECEAIGDERGAKITRRIATELQEKRAAWDEAELSNVQGAQESGYTAQALGRLRASRQWSGRRKDLPRHANASPAPRIDRPSNVVSIADRALAGKAGAPRARSAK